MKKLKDLTNDELIEIVANQRWLHENVDIPYMCYWLKTDSADFWLRYHWRWVNERYLADIPNNSNWEDMTE